MKFAVTPLVPTPFVPFPTAAAVVAAGDRAEAADPEVLVDRAY